VQKQLLRTAGALGALSVLAVFGGAGCHTGRAFGSVLGNGNGGNGMFGGVSTQGSGKKATETRKVASFKRIVLAGSGKMQITAGGAQSLSISIDDNILPQITTVVKGDTLTIGNKGNYSSKMGLTVTATVPTLEGVEIEGSGSAVAKGVKGGRFAAGVSGSGSVEADGAVDTAAVSISGSGNAKLLALKAKTTSVDISGSGRAQVHADEKLSADISGSGSVSYDGHPSSVQKSISGSGSVHPL
jgi:hypothetical protein